MRHPDIFEVFLTVYKLKLQNMSLDFIFLNFRFLGIQRKFRGDKILVNGQSSLDSF